MRFAQVVATVAAQIGHAFGLNQKLSLTASLLLYRKIVEHPKRVHVTA